MDKITELRVQNLRTLVDVRLKLGGLNVLIGRNGTGKSSILEALEVLRRTTEPRFLDSFSSLHRGFRALARRPDQEITLGVRIEDSAGLDELLEYELGLLDEGYGTIVSHEKLVSRLPTNAQDSIVFERTRGRIVVAKQFAVSPFQTANEHPEPTLGPSWAFTPEAPIHRARTCVSRIRVHLPFDVLASWAALENGRKSLAREAAILRPTKRLELLAANLPNAYFTLQNERDTSHWNTTMDYVRLGLGDDVEQVSTRVDSGGTVGVTLKRKRRREPLLARELSDGELAWLSFVAMFRLSGPEDLLAFDEPELHLHPGLLFRVVEMFESRARDGSALLATHSDRLLDCLHEPEQSVVVCDLDHDSTTRLRRPDASALRSWMSRYAGYGAIRSAGHEESVLSESES